MLELSDWIRFKTGQLQRNVRLLLLVEVGWRRQKVQLVWPSFETL